MDCFWLRGLLPLAGDVDDDDDGDGDDNDDGGGDGDGDDDCGGGGGGVRDRRGRGGRGSFVVVRPLAHITGFGVWRLAVGAGLSRGAAAGGAVVGGGWWMLGYSAVQCSAVQLSGVGNGWAVAVLGCAWLCLAAGSTCLRRGRSWIVDGRG